MTRTLLAKNKSHTWMVITEVELYIGRCEGFYFVAYKLINCAHVWKLGPML
jgi:hypothetical protein